MEKFTKVDYSKYQGKYDESFLEKLAQHPEQITIEEMREQLYGYTFTEAYADCEIPDQFFINHWKRDLSVEITRDTFLDDFGIAPQEDLLRDAISSTGDGLTPETALCVIDVHQEYEYIHRTYPYVALRLKSQSLSNGIDCLQFHPNQFGVKCIYFDMRRRFEVGYCRRPQPKQSPNENPDSTEQ